MGALIEINTDGLAKLGETICYSLGLTQHMDVKRWPMLNLMQQ